MFLRLSRHFKADPADVLWHYLTGWFPCYLQDDGGPIGWLKFSHRAIQPLDNIHIGDKQKREVFAKKFELRFDTAFDEVIDRCADPSRDGGNWIYPEVRSVFKQLHRMGFARSFETWEGDQLVGGWFGIQIGSFISCESMFHDVNNAGKAAYVRGLIHLRDRGFSFVDVNFVSDHLARWGAHYIHQWKFEAMLRKLAFEPRAVVDGSPTPALPLSVRAVYPFARAVFAARRRLQDQISRFRPQAGDVEQAPAADAANA
jgi:leucyl/phenylalanyl-tRNA---protein transferase